MNKLKLTPLLKGLATGSIMVALTLWLYYKNIPVNSGSQYLVYLIYAAGIVWTLVGYYLSPGYSGRFVELFGQGFRCFIIVTLIMVAFTGIFTKMHPEFAEESARYYREELVKEKNKTPAEVEADVTRYKKQYTTALVSTAIFGYLLVGVVFTLVTAGLLLLILLLIPLLTRRK